MNEVRTRGIDQFHLPTLNMSLASTQYAKQKLRLLYKRPYDWIGRFEIDRKVWFNAVLLAVLDLSHRRDKIHLFDSSSTI